MRDDKNEKKRNKMRTWVKLESVPDQKEKKRNEKNRKKKSLGQFE